MKPVALIVCNASDESVFFQNRESLDSFIKSGNALFVIDDGASCLEVIPQGAHSIRLEGRSIPCLCDEIVRKAISLDFEQLFMFSPNSIFDIKAIEEMSSVLKCADRHGVVSPRMHREPFFALPVSRPDLCSQEVLNACIITAQDCLPEYSIIPFTSLVCFATKIDLAVNFGLFDKELTFGEASMRDYCNRINQYGYSSVMANHAYVRGSYSYEASVLAADASTINERFPYEKMILDEYLDSKMHPVDRFLDLMVDECYEKPRILLEFSIMPPSHSGTSELQINLLTYFCAMFEQKYSFFIKVNQDALAYHHLKERFPSVCFATDFPNTFHLGFSATQPSSLEQIEYLNTHCLKVVFCLLDIIMCRTDYLRKDDLKARDLTFSIGAEMCDAFIAISEYSKNDYVSYYKNYTLLNKPPIKVIHISTDTSNKKQSECSGLILPFADYYLIAGNKYRHKVLRETVESLKDSRHNYVVIGMSQDECPSDNFVGLTGGSLDDEVVDCLYSKCIAVIFPSVYEGYGLPILNAIKKGKCVVVHDNPLNKELLDSISGLSKRLLYFKYFYEIGDLVERLQHNYDEEKLDLITWNEVIVEIEKYLEKILFWKTSSDALNYRNFLVESASLKETVTVKNDTFLRQLLIERFLEGHSIRYKMVHLAYKIYCKIGRLRKIATEVKV